MSNLSEFVVLEPSNVFFRCVEDSNEAIMLTEKTGKLVYVNPTWCRVYGYSKEEAIGSTPALLHSGKQTREFYNAMWEQIRNPKIGFWKGELVNRTRDGKFVDVYLTITPYRNATGEIDGYMGLAVDISERKQMESRLLHEDRLSAVGLLASGLAHEIGTPMSVIRGRAEFLRMKSTDNPQVESGLTVIIQQIDRMTRLINSLLRLSRQGGEVSARRKISLEPIIAEVVELMAVSLKRAHIEMTVSPAPQTSFFGDEQLVHQVFLNLLLNAIQAIGEAQEQGRLTGHRIEISSRLVNAYVEVCIEDSGCGISPENLGKLFKPFFTTKDVGKGTGLGLAMVAKIVDEMSGEIDVQSKVNEGTRFTLRFRAAPPSPTDTKSDD